MGCFLLSLSFPFLIITVLSLQKKFSAALKGLQVLFILPLFSPNFTSSQQASGVFWFGDFLGGFFPFFFFSFKAIDLLLFYLLGKIDLLLSIFRQPFLQVTWDWKQAEGQVERCFFPDAIYTLSKQWWHVLVLYSWIHIVWVCTCILKWGCPRRKDFFFPPPTLLISPNLN